MYVLAKNSSLVALDAATGKEIWIHENLPGLTTRGITYWESKDRKDRRLIFAINNLPAGDRRPHRQVDPDVREERARRSARRPGPRSATRSRGSSPTIRDACSRTCIILGSAPGEGYLSPPGDIRAYDVITGKTGLDLPHHSASRRIRLRHLAQGCLEILGRRPTPGARSRSTRSAASPTSRPARRPTTTTAPIASATNLFGNCLLALDARTGKRLWHFQMVHHDLWDYDATAAPQLVTVRHNGKPIDAVAQATKQGFLYVFDRVTGKPLWPIEERPVPKSDMPGEQAWPTQPFPTVPPPFARQKMTADDVNPYILTPQERASWKDRIASMRNEGLFTPPGLYESLSLPGARGGANWGSTAANPSKGMVYLTTQDWPTIYKLSLEDPFAERADGRQGTRPPATRAGPPTNSAARSCHGVNGVRSGSGPPALAGVGSRLGFDAFRRVVLSGRAEMPAFPDLDNTDFDGHS